MGKLNIGFLITVAAVIAVLIVLFPAAYLLVPDPARVKDTLGVMQAVVTTLAIVLGGVFAAYKWQIFRESEPHLTISHEVSQRRIGESYVNIAVTAMLHNSSRVHLELSEGFFRLQQVAPASDEDVETLYAQVFVDEEYVDIQWPVLEEVPRTWGRGELIVEPGETHPETFEFIVSSAVEAVNIYTYFYNSTFSPGAQTAEGWGATTVHDMIEARQ